VTEGNSDSASISGAQIRAARALLKWSVRELSARCGISRSAIARNERVNGTPPMRVRNLDTIRRVFEEHGIEFLGLDGVRLLINERPPRRFPPLWSVELPWKWREYDLWVVPSR
jgi:transcriptional regulator with XRE-family HTH domain